MQLYNFIIDFCKKNYIPTRLDELEKLVFDDDCHWFSAINTNFEIYGVHGGKDEDKLIKMVICFLVADQLLGRSSEKMLE